MENENKKSMKYFLYSLVFLTGGSVMVVEILATRLLAPYVGITLFSWSSVIAVILGALSLGYYFGGKMADTTKRLPETMLLAALVGGVLITTIPLFASLVLPLSALAGIRYGPFIASVVLFALPALVLGGVSPMAIKIATERIEKVGSTVGRLYALSSAGSITGTFLAGYILIANWGVKTVLVSNGALLILFSLAGLLLVLRKKLDGSFVFLSSPFAILIIFMLLFQPHHAGTIYEKDSEYYKLRVVEDNISRILYIDSDANGGILLNSSEHLFSYFRIASRITNSKLDSMDYKKPGEARMLALGLGGGILPSEFSDRMQADAVEIDPEVVEVARNYFSLDERVNVIIDDGRTFLKGAGESGLKYDIIFVDVYNSHFSIPYHLVTIEAINGIERILDDRGIVVVNIISFAEGEKAEMLRSLYKTYNKVFPGICMIPARDDNSRAQNIVLVAARADADLPAIDCIKIDDRELDSSNILTDDYSPVENMMAASFG